MGLARVSIYSSFRTWSSPKSKPGPLVHVPILLRENLTFVKDTASLLSRKDDRAFLLLACYSLHVQQLTISKATLYFITRLNGNSLLPPPQPLLPIVSSSTTWSFQSSTSITKTKNHPAKASGITAGNPITHQQSECPTRQ